MASYPYNILQQSWCQAEPQREVWEPQPWPVLHSYYMLLLYSYVIEWRGACFPIQYSDLWLVDWLMSVIEVIYVNVDVHASTCMLSQWLIIAIYEDGCPEAFQLWISWSAFHTLLWVALPNTFGSLGKTTKQHGHSTGSTAETNYDYGDPRRIWVSGQLALDGVCIYMFVPFWEKREESVL